MKQENYELLEIKNILNNKYLAHINSEDTSKEEYLLAHLYKTKEMYNKLNEIKHIDGLIKKCISSCYKDGIDEIYNIFINAIYLHDIGKINPIFQSKKMKNKVELNNDNIYFSEDYFNDKSLTDSNHSLYSSFIYFDLVFNYLGNDKKVLKENDYKKFKILCYSYNFAYEISRHHTFLNDKNQFLNTIEGSNIFNEQNFEDTISLIKSSLKYSTKNYIQNPASFYILNKLLYSLICNCDFMSTGEYMTNTNIDIKIIDNNLLKKFKNNYEKDEIYKKIQLYKLDKNLKFDKAIDKLRCDIYIEAEETLLNNLDKNLFYLEAPTGSGKTNISINLALKLVEKTKATNIFYVFPFNTLIEQTSSILNKYFDKENVVCVNSITEIQLKNKNAYESALLNNQMLNYPIVLTSHVKFFNILFGTSRTDGFPLTKLMNSVVIIDEIQSYKNNIWKHIIFMLNAYAETLNIKIIIMSATLPKLYNLLNFEAEEKTEQNNIQKNYIELISNRELYFENPLFKNRVNCDFSILDNDNIQNLDKEEKEKEIFKEIFNKITENPKKKILIEFISKSRARKFYNYLNDENVSYIYELTGDDNKAYRNEIIKKTKETNEMILIATQVIEAGIDIDMDMGFKDISLIDSDEQFLGRINRSCLKENSIVYFFDLDKTINIYGEDDLRTKYSLKDKELRKLFVNKQFGEIYKKVIDGLNQKSQELNKNNFSEFKKELFELQFKKVSSRLKLIETITFQIFLPYKLELELEFDDDYSKSFIDYESNNVIIDGFELFEYYKNIIFNKELGFAERQVKLSKITLYMSYFSYNVYTITDQLWGIEPIGGYYYIEDGDKYIIDGKFDRQAFTKNKSINELFI